MRSQDKHVPCNIKAEEAVLGAILIDPSCIVDVSLILDGADFYTQKSRWIFEACYAMHLQGKPIDFMTLGTYLEKAGHLEAIGGGVYISELIAATVSAVNAAEYAKTVHETAMRRRLLDAASDIARLAHDEEAEIGDVLSQSEGAVYAVRAGQYDDRLKSIKQVNLEVYEEFEAIERGDMPAAISTGYTDIDRYLTGWRKGELTVIASRPGIGKSSLLFAMTLLSAKAGHGTILFSAEMDRRQVIKRMIQSAGVQNFPGSKYFHDGHWPELYERMSEIDNLPLWIDDTPSITDSEIRAKTLRLASIHNIKHVFVDYIQLLKSARRIDKRYLEVGSICMTLKQLGREADIHVCAAAQLGRAAEGIEPTLAHLKESGGIEENADNVIFVTRARETDPNELCFDADVIIAKQRNGPTGKLKLGWYPSKVTFVQIKQPGKKANVQVNKLDLAWDKLRAQEGEAQDDGYEHYANDL